MDIFKDMSGVTTVAFWSFLAWEKRQSKPLRWMEVGAMAFSLFLYKKTGQRNEPYKKTGQKTLWRPVQDSAVPGAPCSFESGQQCVQSVLTSPPTLHGPKICRL